MAYTNASILSGIKSVGQAGEGFVSSYQGYQLAKSGAELAMQMSEYQGVQSLAGAKYNISLDQINASREQTQVISQQKRLLETNNSIFADSGLRGGNSFQSLAAESLNLMHKQLNQIEDDSTIRQQSIMYAAYNDYVSAQNQQVKFQYQKDIAAWQYKQQTIKSSFDMASSVAGFVGSGAGG